MNFRQYTYIILLALLISSCKKDIDVFTPYPVVGDISLLQNDLQRFEQSFLINSEMKNFVVTNAKSIISVPSHSFIDVNGDPVSGILDFKVIELLDPSMMLIYDIPSIDNHGQLLRNYGGYVFSASQNNQPVRLIDEAEVSVRMPNESAAEFTDVYSSIIELSSPWSIDLLNSGLTNEAKATEWSYQDNQQSWSDFGYLFNVESFEAFCVASVVESVEHAALCVELPINYIESNTKVFAIIDEYQSVVPMYVSDNSLAFCAETELLPLGVTIDVIVLSDQSNEDYYMSVLENVYLEETNSFMLTPEKRNIEEILDVLGMF